MDKSALTQSRTCLEWRDDTVLLLREWDGLLNVGEDFSRPLASDWLRLSEDPYEFISERRPQTPLSVWIGSLLREICCNLPKDPCNVRRCRLELLYYISTVSITTNISTCIKVHFWIHLLFQFNFNVFTVFLICWFIVWSTKFQKTQALYLEVKFWGTCTISIFWHFILLLPCFLGKYKTFYFITFIWKLILHVKTYEFLIWSIINRTTQQYMKQLKFCLNWSLIMIY